MYQILGLQPRDKVAMLGVNTKETFLLNLHQNRIQFPAERNVFVLDHQHGHRDVTCKPAIAWPSPFKQLSLRKWIVAIEDPHWDFDITARLINRGHWPPNRWLLNNYRGSTVQYL